MHLSRCSSRSCCSSSRRCSSSSSALPSSTSASCSRSERVMAAVEAEIHGDAATEGGFGTGLRAKLEGGGNPVEEPPAPRSPSEAIAAATPSDSSDVQALRAELSASLAREQELRTSLTDQLE